LALKRPKQSFCVWVCRTAQDAPGHSEILGGGGDHTAGVAAQGGNQTARSHAEVLSRARSSATFKLSTVPSTASATEKQKLQTRIDVANTGKRALAGVPAYAALICVCVTIL